MGGDAVDWPEHQLRVHLSYLLRGDRGVDALARSVHRRAHDRHGGRFGKREVAYLPQSLVPPLAWRYSCGRCRFWHEGEPGEPGRCHVVGREGDPFGGEAIHPRGWCGLWTPPEGEPPFAWFRERLAPDGASSVRGEYRPRATKPPGRPVRIDVEERSPAGARERSVDGGPSRGDGDGGPRADRDADERPEGEDGD